MLLEGGLASGSGGCNTFSGTYALDGTTLMFGEEISTTLMLCEESVQAVEDAYLSALPEVVGWTMSDGVLQLSDESGRDHPHLRGSRHRSHQQRADRPGRQP